MQVQGLRGDRRGARYFQGHRVYKYRDYGRASAAAFSLSGRVRSGSDISARRVARSIAGEPRSVLYNRGLIAPRTIRRFAPRESMHPRPSLRYTPLEDREHSTSRFPRLGSLELLNRNNGVGHRTVVSHTAPEYFIMFVR